MPSDAHLNVKMVHAIVHGDVQGVGFRYTTQKVAYELGITGTVCNLPDGSVEIYAKGPQDMLELFFASIKQRTAGHVTHMHQEPSSVAIVNAGFEIVYKR